MEKTVLGGLRSNQQAHQHCFIGHSQGASWRETFEQVCEEVLPNFGLQPWYADKHYQGSVPLRQKVVNMIATTRYGIYDLSSWRKNDQSTWMMPRNVLIELGMAIALNRPLLLLRHGKNRECGLTLPACLEGIEIGEFGDGKKMLKETLNMRLPALMQRTPKQDWLNRYCHFGGLECSYREAHPQAQQWGRQKIHIHVSDGVNAAHIDYRDFHDMIEDDVISRYSNLEFNYLDSLTSPQGHKFLLCSRCQEVRSSPFAIYRITPHTSADTFIAIGMSIALEKQFNYTITKILITDDANTIPSLLKGYEIIEEQKYARIKDRLNAILPAMIEEMKQTTWKPQPLPFEVILPDREVAKREKEMRGQEEDVMFEDLPIRGEPSEQNFIEGEEGESQEAVTDILFQFEETSGQLPDEVTFIKAYKEVQNGNIIDPLTIRRIAAKFEQVANDPKYSKKVSFDAPRAASNLYEQAQHIEDQFRESINDTPFPEEPKRKLINIFLSYAHEDRELLNQLKKHMYPLEREGLINVWHDGEIVAGKDWTSIVEEIDVQLNTADVILLLISADFIASEFCYSKEMVKAMERHKRGEAYVIPVLLRPVHWEGEPFSDFSVLPANRKPISMWSNVDRAFSDVVKGIRRVLEDLQKKS